MIVNSAKKGAERKAIVEINTPRTRLDTETANRKREVNRKAVKKHRENMPPQKRRRLLESRRKNYRENKDKETAENLQRREKTVQTEQAFLQSECPYPTEGAFHRAVRRVKAKLRARGTKLAFLVKGVIKTSSKKTKEKLKELNVLYASPHKAPLTTPATVAISVAAAPPTTPASAAISVSAADTLKKHVEDINKKRNKDTLKHKRSLATAFGDRHNIGLTKK